jgi:hypothetical protein
MHCAEHCTDCAQGSIVAPLALQVQTGGGGVKVLDMDPRMGGGRSPTAGGDGTPTAAEAAGSSGGASPRAMPRGRTQLGAGQAFDCVRLCMAGVAGIATMTQVAPAACVAHNICMSSIGVTSMHMRAPAGDTTPAGTYSPPTRHSSSVAKVRNGCRHGSVRRCGCCCPDGRR